MDALVDLALAEDLETEFLWNTDSPEWREGTHRASAHPQMLIGTSDAGAHLGRDDGAEFSSYFLRYWVREWQHWTLEAAIRELTAIPAGLLGLYDRGLVHPGYAADLFLFDPETASAPARRACAKTASPVSSAGPADPVGVRAVIVNGVPIVEQGEIVDERTLPGQVLAPG